MPYKKRQKGIVCKPKISTIARFAYCQTYPLRENKI